MEDFLNQVKTRVFFDTEFTGLHQKTTLISIGLVAQTGEMFYAELIDYDHAQLNDWIVSNVTTKLYLNVKENIANKKATFYKGSHSNLKHWISQWMEQFDIVEMWSDCLAYDWVLFCHIFGSAFDIPKNIYYIPFDIATLFKERGVDPDISREKFAYGEAYNEMLAKKHTALWDAQTIKTCFEKLKTL